MYSALKRGAVRKHLMATDAEFRRDALMRAPVASAGQPEWKYLARLEDYREAKEMAAWRIRLAMPNFQRYPMTSRHGDSKQRA